MFIFTNLRLELPSLDLIVTFFGEFQKYGRNVAAFTDTSNIFKVVYRKNKFGNHWYKPLLILKLLNTDPTKLRFKSLINN